MAGNTDDRTGAQTLTSVRLPYKEWEAIYTALHRVNHRRRQDGSWRGREERAFNVCGAAFDRLHDALNTHSGRPGEAVDVAFQNDDAAVIIDSLTERVEALTHEDPAEAVRLRSGLWKLAGQTGHRIEH